MTIQQKNAAIETVENLPYTGFSTVLIDANGHWTSPADATRLDVPGATDTLLFSWLQTPDGPGYKYVPRDGDVAGKFTRADGVWKA